VSGTCVMQTKIFISLYIGKFKKAAFKTAVKIQKTHFQSPYSIQFSSYSEKGFNWREISLEFING